MNNSQITNHKFLPFFSRAKGFTLIELLIVIVIIGILSTLVIANFVGVRARARDAQRKTDLSQIRTALQLYYSDNGEYPGWGAGGGDSPACGAQFVGGTVTYIQEMPCDPQKTNEKYVYVPSPTNCGTTDSCSGYALRACLENQNDSDKDPTDNCADTRVGYTVRNP